MTKSKNHEVHNYAVLLRSVSQLKITSELLNLSLSSKLLHQIVGLGIGNGLFPGTDWRFHVQDPSALPLELTHITNDDRKHFLGVKCRERVADHSHLKPSIGID